MSRSEAYAEIALALARAGQAEQALAAAGQIADAEERSEAYRAIALALVQAGQAEQALAVAGQIADASKRSEAYCAIALALVQAGQAEQALAVAGQIADAKERSEVYRVIASALAQAGDKLRAQEVFTRALEAARQIRNASSRYDALWRIALAAAEVGAGELAQQLVLYELPVGRGENLPPIIDALSQRGEKTALLALLPLCGWSPGMAIKASLLLAMLYPQHNLAVLEVLARELGVGAEQALAAAGQIEDSLPDDEGG